MKLSIRIGRTATIAALLAAAPAAFALTLSQAERLVLERNPDIALGAATVSSAQGGIIAAGQRPNPTLSMQTVNIDPDRGVGAGPLRNKSVDSTLGLSWMLERGDKRALRLGTAEGQLKAARFDLADVRRQQRLALHNAYFDLKQAQERVRLLTESQSLAQQSLAAADKRVALGDLAPLDRARLQVDVIRTQNDRRAAEGDLEAAREALGAVLGGSRPAGTLAADDDWPVIGTLPEAGSVARAARRPDLQAALAREGATQAARDLARSQAVRDVTLGASVERFPPDMRGSFGVSVSVPLFVSHAYEGEIARAQADIDAARIQREKASIAASAEAGRAFAQLSAARDRLERLQGEGLSAAGEAARGIEYAYERGAASLTDLLDARRQLRALQLDVVQAHADFARSLAAWRAATEWEQEP
jgi:cobalt-zinc-cadmium efflux system outer membrane protein